MSRILSVEYQLPQTWGQFFTSQLSFTNLRFLQEIEVSKNSSPPILMLYDHYPQILVFSIVYLSYMPIVYKYRIRLI